MIKTSVFIALLCQMALFQQTAAVPLRDPHWQEAQAHLGAVKNGVANGQQAHHNAAVNHGYGGYSQGSGSSYQQMASAHHKGHRLLGRSQLPASPHASVKKSSSSQQSAPPKPPKIGVSRPPKPRSLERRANMPINPKMFGKKSSTPVQQTAVPGPSKTGVPKSKNT